MIAPRTERRFTRDLIFEAVPYSPVSILLAFEIYRMREIGYDTHLISRTDNQGDHRGAISNHERMRKTFSPLSILKSLNQLLDSPHLNVLLFWSHTVEVLCNNQNLVAFHTVMMNNDEIHTVLVILGRFTLRRIVAVLPIFCRLSVVRRIIQSATIANLQI